MLSLRSMTSRNLKNHKYGARRINLHDGRSFASMLEAALYDQLKLREKCGEIRDIECQVKVYLTDARIGMIPDFYYFDTRLMENVYSEAKGFVTSDWNIKKRLWTVYGPGRLEIWGGTHNNLRLIEEIIPKGGKR